MSKTEEIHSATEAPLDRPEIRKLTAFEISKIIWAALLQFNKSNKK
jgi:hypothetical protein